MFDQLPASRSPRLDPLGAALTGLSLLLHGSAVVSLILAPCLTLPSIAFPKVRPLIAPPVFFFPLSPGGAPASKLGRPHPASPSPASPPAETRRLEPPREIPDAASQPPADSGAVQDASAGTGPEGDPEGAVDGEAGGRRGGHCVGEGCDPDGSLGAGEGIPGEGTDLDPIQRPGIGDVTEPVLIESSKVLPRYPELARRAGVSGRVILEAIVQIDGTVASVRILRETPPHVGFGEAASVAVARWRYRPGTQQDRPVAVYFTVIVDFALAR
jgi:TonB family protein